jgi:sugar phosphate permease
MLASEAVFILPFVVARVFRPTFLGAFDINNFELGSAFSWYGITAMLSYFLGGPLADRFEARKLLTLSLLVTGLSGFYMATLPSLSVLTVLYAFWGFSTILLFWAASIKSIRQLGAQSQGKAFGLVDAGRGLLAAVLASASVWALAMLLPTNAENASEAQLASALSQIIQGFSAFIILLGVLIFWLFPKKQTYASGLGKIKWLQVVKRPAVWWQALIVLCAYVGYKVTDDFSLYASDALNFNDVKAAQVGTISFWMRPFAALLAGYLGDKFWHSGVISGFFGLMLAGSLVLANASFLHFTFVLTALNIAALSLGIYGLRGLYFALLQEAHLPMSITGSAVGFISLVGYTPDVFMGPLMGYLLDENPGVRGHQYVFLVLAAFSLLGIAASYGFKNSVNKGP